MGKKRLQAFELEDDWADVRDPEILAQLNKSSVSLRLTFIPMGKRDARPTIPRPRRSPPLPRSLLQSRAANVSKPMDAGIRKANR
jgi:hypothetical protein